MAQAAANSRFTVEQRSPDRFAVLGPNPHAGLHGAAYAGDHLTLCVTDNQGDADLIALAMNAFPDAQAWPISTPAAPSRAERIRKTHSA